MNDQPLIIGKWVVTHHPLTFVKETYAVLDKITTESGATAYLVNLVGSSEVKVIKPWDIKAVHNHR